MQFMIDYYPGVNNCSETLEILQTWSLTIMVHPQESSIHKVNHLMLNLIRGMICCSSLDFESGMLLHFKHRFDPSWKLRKKILDSAIHCCLLVHTCTVKGRHTDTHTHKSFAHTNTWNTSYILYNYCWKGQ